MSRASSSGPMSASPPADTMAESDRAPPDPTASDGQEVRRDRRRGEHRQEREVLEDPNEAEDVRERDDEQRDLRPGLGDLRAAHGRGPPVTSVRPSVDRTRGRIAASHSSANDWSLPTTITLVEPSRDMKRGSAFGRSPNATTVTEEKRRRNRSERVHLRRGHAQPRRPRARRPTRCGRRRFDHRAHRRRATQLDGREVLHDRFDVRCVPPRSRSRCRR